MPGLLRTYRRRFGAVPFVRAAFRASLRGTIELFAREAHDKLVFHLKASP